MVSERSEHRFWNGILSLFLESDQCREIAGDLEEACLSVRNDRGPFHAGTWYGIQVLKTVKFSVVDRFFWRAVMLKNYLKIALRNIQGSKFFSFINIFGLALGMAACLMIVMYVRHELSYDDYNLDADRIYRVAGSYRWGGRDFDIAVSPPAQAQAMLDDFPEVEEAVRFSDTESNIVRVGETSFREWRVTYADASFFSMFTVPLLKGDPETALEAPHTLVLSRTTADKYFRDQDPIGKTLRLDNKNDFKVTGVFQDIPDNSHFYFDIMLSMASLKEAHRTTWLDQNFQTYIRLRPGTNPAVVEAKFPAMLEKYMAAVLEKFTGRDFHDQVEKGDLRIVNYLQPLRSIHLHSDLVAEFEPNSDIRYIYVFSAVALFILLIAVINFMNLSTARSAGRAKEVGVRKVMGCHRRQLVTQFLTESLLLSFLSMAAAIGMGALLLPLFNQLAGKRIAFVCLLEGAMPLWILLLTAAAGFLAGGYPAFFISAFRPALVIKGRIRSGLKTGLFRGGLVVFQFAASIVLIIATLVVAQQLRYTRQKNLGFEKEQVIILDNTFLLGDQVGAFKEEMLARPQIKSATISSFLPTPSNRINNGVFPDGDINSGKATSLQNWEVDHDYLVTMGMTLTAGRFFFPDFPTDVDSACLINQAAARYFGWSNPLEHKLGRTVSREGDLKIYNVIGVIKDFHFESLRDNIGPLVMYLGNSRGRISFRIGTADVSGVIEALRGTWERFLPHQPFEYSFMDDRFESMYRAERRIGRIFGVFAGLALLIGCLGLFGLASFTAEKKTKEIGIRKILGATAPGIVGRLMREYVLLMGIANLIAWPLAFFITRRWLQNFAYRVSPGPMIFVAAGGATLMITLMTAAFQAIKAATADPADSLRYE